VGRRRSERARRRAADLANDADLRPSTPRAEVEQLAVELATGSVRATEEPMARPLRQPG